MFFCAAWPAPRSGKPGEVSEERMIQSRVPWRTRWAPVKDKGDADAIDKYVGYGILRSKDDGATWKFEKMDIAIPNASYGFINTSGSDTGIVIRSGPRKGRLLVPVCATVNETAIYNFLHSRKMRVPWMQRAPYFRYCGTAIYSDDHGKTWQAGGFGSVTAAESCLAELPDGSIYLNSAASGGWRAQCRSKDSGATWGQFALSYLRDGHSGTAGSIVSLPKNTGNRPCLVLTAPAHNESGFDSRRDRKKFTANVSFDGGKTWPIKKLINEGPSGYSVSVVGKEGAIFVLYEKGDKVYYDKGVSIVKFDPKWLLKDKEK
jgi:sialidase-1